MDIGRQKRRLTKTIGRKVVLVAVALAVLGATLGFPVVARRDVVGSVPFPCQHHGCGCVSAEACWNGCCCFTPAERRAWAKKHGVTPPDFFLAQFGGSPIDGATISRDSADASSGNDGACDSSHHDACCPHPADDDMEEHEPAKAGLLARSCCSHQDENNGSAGSEAVETDESNLTFGIAIGGMSQRCRGQSSLWAMVQVMLPVRQFVRIDLPQPCVLRMTDTTHYSIDRPAPPVPPPRALLA
jgi:hypothetical protein